MCHSIFNLFYFSTTKLCREHCNDDSQCENNEICLDSECQKGCKNDNHCSHGSECFQNECRKICQTNSVCGDFQYCHIDHKVCLYRCNGHNPKSPCEEGYKCVEPSEPTQVLDQLFYLGQCFSPCIDSSECLAQNQYCRK